MAQRDLSSVQQLLPRLLGRLARESGQAAGLAPVWAAAVGAHSARHSRPHLFEGGTLVVTVASAEWAQALARQEAALCERLNAHLGPGTVEALSFRLE